MAQAVRKCALVILMAGSHCTVLAANQQDPAFIPRNVVAQSRLAATTAPSWRTLRIGAGGFLRGLNIAPDGTMVAHTDTYGAYRWTGTQWTQLVTATSMPAALLASQQDTGTLAQGVYEIQVAPSVTHIFYMMYDGYLFRSGNFGGTWAQTAFAQTSSGEDNPNGSYAALGQKMAVDPNNPNVVYIGTEDHGLFVTTDGGKTVDSVTQVPLSAVDPNSNPSGQHPPIDGVLFDPAAPAGVAGGKTQTIFAVSYGNGVYRSTDAGASWSLLSGGPPTIVLNAAVSATGAYYAVDSTNDLWIYANGAWTEETPAQTGNSYNVQAVAINPANPNEIVLTADAGYLDVSYDGGKSWSGLSWSSNNVNSTDIPWLTQANESPGGNFLDVAATQFNPLSPNQMMASAGTGVWNVPIPASGFTDTTTITFQDQSLGIEQLVANAIISPPGGKPVVASWDRAFFRIANPNQFPSTYGPADNDGINPGWSVDYASSKPSYLAGLTANGIAYYSVNGGTTWNHFAAEPSFPDYANGGTIAASTPANIILAPGDGVQPYYTLNGGKTWAPVTLPGVTDWSSFEGAYYLDERSITADRVLANTFYLYYPGNGVFETTNGGKTWTQVYDGDDGFGSGWTGYIVPWSWYNNELMSVPGEAGNLFFTTGAQSPNGSGNPFMRSTNGGASWGPVANVLDVSCFGFGITAPGQNYPAIYIVGWVNNVYGTFQSVDNAQSWTQIGTYDHNSLDAIKTISGDMNIFGQVYAGFGGSGYAYLPAAD